MTEWNFRHRTYNPAAPEEIAEIERRFGFRFCDDFRAFALSDNGLEVEEGYGGGDGGWIYELHRLFGVGAGTNCSVEQVKQFFDPRFLPICYPVGEDGGGNLMVQIAAGARRGRIAMLDHEVFYGGMAALLDVVDGFYPDQDDEAARLPFKSFAEATPDQIVDACYKDGFLSEVELTFGEFLPLFAARVSAAVEEERARPKPAVTPEALILCIYACVWSDEGWRPAEKLAGVYGDFFVLHEAEGLAAEYRVTADAAEVNARLSFVGPEGAVLQETTAALIVGDTYQFRMALKCGEGPCQSGDYTFHLRFPDNPEIAPVSERVRIVVGAAPFPFTVAQNDPAREDEIAAFEAKWPYRFCEDFRQWCKSRNGLVLSWRGLALWDSLDDDARERFDAEAKALKDTRWEFRVQEIGGFLRTFTVFNEYSNPRVHTAQHGVVLKLRAEEGKPNAALLYPVAGAYGGDIKGFRQVAVGAHRGRIVELLAYDFDLDRVADVKDGRRTEGQGKKAKTFQYPFATYAEASPDQILDAWIAEGLVRLTDMDFAALSKAIIAAHAEAFEHLFNKYLRPVLWSEDETT